MGTRTPTARATRT